MFIMMFSFAINGFTSSAASYGEDGYDTSVFDTTWTKSDAETWIYRFKSDWWNPMSWGYTWDKHTVAYIRIVDEKGKKINDITRIEAKYIRNGKLEHVQRDIDLNYVSSPGIIDFGSEGIFTSYEYFWDEIDVSTTVFKHDKLSKTFDDYQECNYIWEWKANVTKIMCMYVWYLNDSGNEVASSFYENGAHPKYDENGKFLGIYDTKDELLKNYNLNENGLITCDEMEIDLSEKQIIDEKEGSGSSYDFPSIIPGLKDASDTVKNIINGLVLVISVILGIVIFVLLFVFIRWIYRRLKG